MSTWEACGLEGREEREVGEIGEIGGKGEGREACRNYVLHQSSAVPPLVNITNGE